MQFFLTAFGAQTFAQTSGKAPYAGATHQYWVNGAFGDTKTGSAYTWWVSVDTDLHAPINQTDFTVVTTNGGADYNTSGSENGIELTWNASAAGKTYYLVVQEDSASCSNLKVIPIQPVNAFDVIFAAIDGSNSDADDPSRCAPDIALTASGTTITYDYGEGEYIYKITSAGVFSDWTFDFNFTNSLGVATADIGYSTDGSTYSTGESNSGTKNVTPVSGAATVYFKVSVDYGDTDTPATSEEVLSELSMTLELTNISDGSNAPAHIYMSDGTSEFTGNVEQVQTVNERPKTTGIQTN